MALEFIGYLGGFLIAIALAPQLIKTYKTNQRKTCLYCGQQFLYWVWYYMVYMRQ